MAEYILLFSIYVSVLCAVFGLCAIFERYAPGILDRLTAFFAGEREGHEQK